MAVAATVIGRYENSTVANKRYQVFVSSTFRDLSDERARVMQAVLAVNAMPAGMELFPAFDEEQFAYIKRIIEDCDYYVLIVGGRYGSTTADGVSYTEKEFEYAMELGVPVLAFLHSDPSAIPVGKSDIAPEARERLERFRARAATGRLVKEWATPDKLELEVTRSLTKAFAQLERPGWIRGGRQDEVELLRRIKDLSDENARLLAQGLKPTVEDLAPPDSPFELTYISGVGAPESKAELSWDQMLAIIGPSLHGGDQTESGLSQTLGRFLANGGARSSAELTDECVQKVRIQFDALGWIKTTSIGVGNSMIGFGSVLQWSLTPAGRNRMIRLVAAKRKG
jgi:hypothetical protein